MRYKHKDGSWADYPESPLELHHPTHVIRKEHLVGTTFEQPEPMYDAYYTVSEVIDGETKLAEKQKGTKSDSGKAPIHMIPEDAIIGMAEAFGYGAIKYDRFNYRKGLDITRLTDSLIRHTLAYLKGEDLDPESGLHHTKHILANAAMIEYMRINKPEHDDRYKNEDKKKID